MENAGKKGLNLEKRLCFDFQPILSILAGLGEELLA
jgi:hypothetical protein